jgi:hypothetical protein
MDKSSNLFFLCSKNFNDLEILNINNEYNYIFLTKDESKLKQDFLNIFLLEFLNKNKENIVKGKMRKICKELIYQLDIPNISLELQENIIYQHNVNINTINKNNEQINNYKILREQFNMNIINLDKHQTEKLSNIFNISNVLLNESYIIIKRNSLTAGAVEIVTNKELFIDNTNYYYLNFKKEINEYYYYILKYLENILIFNSAKNKSIGLNRNFLENLDIPILSEIESKHFIEVNKFFDNQIEFLVNTNKSLDYFYINLLALLN